MQFFQMVSVGSERYSHAGGIGLTMPMGNGVNIGWLVNDLPVRNASWKA